MNLVFSFLSIFIVSLGSLVVIISNTPPAANFSIINIGFFVFIYLLIYSLTYLISYIFKNKNKSLDRLLNRRILIFTTLITGIMIMLSLQVLNIISSISFILSITLLELFFMSQSKL